jgi:hypothetical protein
MAQQYSMNDVLRTVDADANANADVVALGLMQPSCTCTE